MNPSADVSGSVVGTSSGFVIPLLGLQHCDKMEIYNRRYFTCPMILQGALCLPADMPMACMSRTALCFVMHHASSHEVRVSSLHHSGVHEHGQWHHPVSWQCRLPAFEL